MKRLALAAVAAGFALLVGAAAYLLWSLDARVARAIEDEGTRIVGTRVRVHSVDIDLAAGKGTIRGVRVANPEGYSASDVIALAAIEIAIDERSLGGKAFHVKRVRVGDSVVNFEIHEDGGSNIERIVRHIRGSDREGGEPVPHAEPTRFAIGELAFAGGEIFLAREGAENLERVHLPGLELRDVGGAAGATGGEIGQQIALAFTRRVIAATAGHQLGRAVEKELGEAAGDAAETIIRHVLE
ncbi:MAG TPA: hypothetical protein VKH41_07530 [Myxococcota bacterium]|nr:hypothetical protein [Myxococcota bacterium]